VERYLERGRDARAGAAGEISRVVDEIECVMVSRLVPSIDFGSWRAHS